MVIILLAAFSIPVLAYSTTVKVTLELTGYSKDMTVTEKVTPDGASTTTQNSTVAANTSATWNYNADDEVILTITPSAEMPTTQWEVNGEIYSIPEGKTSFTKDFGDPYYVTISIRPTFFRMNINYPGMDEEWTVRPIVAQDGFSATVDVADKEQGSAIAVKNATNEFELKATANPGYSFDYWLVKSDSSKITENPKTVTLTADETYTAYFRTWKQATVSSEPEGLTSGTDTDLVTAARKWDDTWMLRANNAVLAGRNYVFSYWSCDEDSSFKSEKNPLEVTLTEDRHYVAHYLPWQITGISGMSAGGGSWMAKTETGSRPLIAGTGVTVDVDYDENITDVWLPHSTIELYSVGCREGKQVRKVFRVRNVSCGKGRNGHAAGKARGAGRSGSQYRL